MIVDISLAFCVMANPPLLWDLWAKSPAKKEQGDCYPLLPHLFPAFAGMH